MYLDYVESGGEKKELVEKILAYNEDDCQATMVIKDWLIANQA